MQVTHPDLAGKVAVVTGAGRGLGAAFAAALARRGVRVVAGDLEAPPSDDPAVVGARVDVRDPDDHAALAALAVERFGRLDVWINNAGVYPEGYVPDVAASQVRSTLEVNVDGVLHGAQAAARAMAAGGCIVNMASTASVRVRPGRAVYAASKAAVAHLTEALAIELGSRGIRVNALAPGLVETEMTRPVREDAEQRRQALARMPLERFATTEDVVGPMLFLVSDSARYVTGQVLFVDGGSRLV